MGALTDLVGDVFDLKPPLAVEPGFVLVTLKYGRATGVVRPGRKLRRGKGLPFTSSPQGVLVSTQDIPLAASVPDIHLADSYGLTALDVEYVIAVSSSNDYAALLRYINSKGLNFAELLDLEVSNEIDRRTREAVRGRTSQELYELGNLSDLIASNLSTLIDGLFQIRTVLHPVAHFAPEYLEARKGAAAEATRQAAATMEIASRDLDLELQRARDDRLQAAADRRGQSISEYENPELAQQIAAQDHEVRIELLRNMDGIRRGGGHELLQQAVNGLAHASHTIEPVARPAELAASVEAIGLRDLGSDPVLSKMICKPGLLEEHARAVMVERGGETAVVLVTTSVVDDSTRGVVAEKLKANVDATDIVFLTGTTAEEIVLDFLGQRVPALAHAETIEIWVTRSANIATVELESTGARLSGALRSLKDADSGYLDQLAALLDAGSVDLRAR